MVTRKKHRVFKYSYLWFGRCGRCAETFNSTCWSGAVGLLSIHVNEHAPLTRNTTASQT